MSRQGRIYAIALAMWFVSATTRLDAACLGTANSESPDGQLIARITRTGSTGCGESRIEITDRHQERIVSIESLLEGDATDPDFKIVLPHNLEIVVSNDRLRRINLEKVGSP